MAESVFDRDKRIRSAQLSMGQTFYLITLNQFIGRNCDAWPSQTTIAASMNATPRAVRKWQTELEQLGVIAVDIGKGRSLTNRYRLNLESLPLKEEPRSAFNDETENKRGTTFLPNEEPRSYEMRNHVPTERTGKEHKKEQRDSVPSELNTPEFLEAWSQWEKHRRELRKKLTPSTKAQQLALLASWGPAKAVRAIGNSITAGWQGLFDPDGKRGDKTPTTAVDWWPRLKKAVIDSGRETGTKRIDTACDILRSQGASEAVIDAVLACDRRRLKEITEYNEKAARDEFHQQLTRTSKENAT